MQVGFQSILCGGVISCLVVLANGVCPGKAQVRPDARTTTPTEVRRVSKMIGSSAQLKAGDKVGKVKDLVIDKESTIEFVVVDFEEELILVPFNLIQVDIAREVIIIDVERERLRRFRRISKITEVQTLSTILKASIALRGGGTFGQVEDIVIRERGRVDFVVVIFEERLFAVPFSLARLDFARQVVAIDVERERLLRAPTFTRDQFANLSVNSEFSRQVNTFFQVPKERGEQPARPGMPTTRPPEKRLPETQPPTKRPPEPRPPAKRPPPKRPPDKGTPEKPPPQTESPDKHPPETGTLEPAA